MKTDNLTAYSAYFAGMQNKKNFSFKKGLNALIKADKAGEYICKAGKYWKKFDSNKGMEALAQVDKTGRWIFNAGINWKTFDYKKGLDALIKKDKKWLHAAGKSWKEFNYERGIRALKSGVWHKSALENWPKGIKASQKRSKEIKSKAKILPMKKLKLKESTKNLTTKQIYNDGMDQKDFDYNKGLNNLIKIDRIGKWIYYAGADWKTFDYDKGIEALKNKNKYWHKSALKEWPIGIKASQAISKKIRDTAKKLPKKTLKLEDFIEEINNEIY